MTGVIYARCAYEFEFLKLAEEGLVGKLVIFNKITQNRARFARFSFDENQPRLGSVFRGGFLEIGGSGDFCIKSAFL